MSAPPEQRPDVTLLLGRFGAGGVERVACILANGFAERGLSTEIAVARAEGPTRGLVDPQVRIVRLAGKQRLLGGRALPLLAAAPALASHLREHRPRLLLSPGNHTHVAAALAHRLSGGESRLALKITNPILKARHGPLRRAARKRLYRWIFGRANRILVLSPHGFEQVAEISESAVEKTRFVHNPYIDSAALARLAMPSQPLDGPPIILAVGRLTRQKNYSMLLRAMARLKQLDWGLVFLGEGPQEENLREEALKLGIAERVRFEGFVKDPAPYYERARLLALSSDWEDLPAVVLEALASGCPVVATACSQALVSIVEEAQGDGLVPVGDDAAFAAAVAKVISAPPLRRPFAGAQAYSFEAGIQEHLTALDLS